GGRFRVLDGAFDDGTGDVLADVPAASLGDGPVYTRPWARPETQDELNAADPWPSLASRFPAGGDLGPELLALLRTPNLADKSWVWGQYDHQLFLNTVVGPGADATVLRLRGTRRALALSTDGSAAFCRLDPRVGGRLAVLEAARNVACVGAVPRAVVNCLNFGNPEHPTVMWQFAEVVDGIQDACRALGVPVIGGNVSFYNESHGQDIDPTPVIGLVGLLDPLDGVPPAPALGPDEAVVLLGRTNAELGGSAWAAHHDLTGGRAPAADLDAAVAVHECVRRLVVDGAVRAVHDCAEGGVAVALAEMAVAGECGATITPPDDLPVAAWCFSESASRVVVTAAVDAVGDVLACAAADGVPALELGRCGGARLHVEGAFDVDLAEATRDWRGGLPTVLEQL
ncbi:MAG TPA: AIR synthase related protein, partial [Acidimicrobiia bacterium]|nr:AIR synthase related protein [Acidimicrobiia bacterium]